MAQHLIDLVDGVVGYRVQPFDLGYPLGLHEDEDGADRDDRQHDAETNGQLPGEWEVAKIQFHLPVVGKN